MPESCSFAKKTKLFSYLLGEIFKSPGFGSSTEMIKMTPDQLAYAQLEAGFTFYMPAD